MLKGVFGFPEQQEKATNGFGYKLTLMRNKDNAAPQKSVALADARTKSDHMHCCVSLFTQSIQQQGILSKQTSSKTPTALRHIEQSVFLKKVNNQNLWNFELGSQGNMSVPKWMIIGFQQQDRQDSENLKIDSFCTLPVTSAQCMIGTENYPGAGMLLNYDDDNSLGNGEIKETFRALTKIYIPQPYISDDVFRSSNAGIAELGYNLYVFDIRYQQNFAASQPIKVHFKFDGAVPHDINGYALVLTS